MTQRTKSKFVFASPARTAEALFKYFHFIFFKSIFFIVNFDFDFDVGFVDFSCRYVSPEHVPIQYGGLSVDYCDCNPEFTIDDPAAVVTVKPATKQTVEIIVNEV